MTEHMAIVCWGNRQEVFTDNHYSREHTWSFDEASKFLSLLILTLFQYPSNPACVDPAQNPI